MTDKNFSCLLCGAKVNFGFGGDDIVQIKSRKEICSKFVTLVAKYLDLKSPIQPIESPGGLVCCQLCLFAITDFCGTYQKLECVQLEMLGCAESISKLLTSESATNYGFRNEFISSVESKRRQHCPDFTPRVDDHDDDEKHFQDSVMDTMDSTNFVLPDDREDEEETEVKHELLDECHEDGISDDGDGDIPNFPDNFYSIIKYNIGDISIDAAVTTISKPRLPTPKECTFCDKKYSNGQDLQGHLRSHTGEKPSWCHLCLKEYVTRCSVARHIKLHHKKAKDKCDICGQLVADIHQHRRQKHGFGPKSVCGVCGKTFKSQNKLARHQVVHTGERNYECDICHIKLKYSQQLKLHKLKFHGEGKIFHCYSCGLDFETKGHWFQHRREEHKGKGSFKCPHESCQLVFTKHFKLKSHLRSHSQEKPAQCEQCGSSFYNISTLNTHIEKIHSLANPIKCKYCDETFTDKRLLVNHKKAHVFDCDICGKIFKRWSILKTHRDGVHLNNEKPYVCEICGETLKNHYYMQMHKIKVHERKMFECPQPSCKFSTYFKKNLKQHAKSHTSPFSAKERPFQCDLCSTRFTLKCSVGKHLKKMHPEEKK